MPSHLFYHKSYQTINLRKSTNSPISSNLWVEGPSVQISIHLTWRSSANLWHTHRWKLKPGTLGAVSPTLSTFIKSHIMEEKDKFKMSWNKDQNVLQSRYLIMQWWMSWWWGELENNIKHQNVDERIFFVYSCVQSATIIMKNSWAEQLKCKWDVNVESSSTDDTDEGPMMWRPRSIRGSMFFLSLLPSHCRHETLAEKHPDSDSLAR